MLFTMNADGTGRQLVTTFVSGPGFAWSPDGSKLVVKGLKEIGMRVLMVVGANGTNPTVIQPVVGSGGVDWACTRRESPTN